MQTESVALTQGKKPSEQEGKQINTQANKQRLRVIVLNDSMYNNIQ